MLVPLVLSFSYVMVCAIRYHLYNGGGVLLLVTLQIEACNCNKRDTPLLVFLTILKLRKWYQIAQSISYNFSVS